MTSAVSVGLGELWSEVWAVQAAVEADRLDGQLRIIEAGGSLDARGEASVTEIRRLLNVARQATRRKHRWIKRRGPIDRWRGSSVEQAFRCLHAAKIFLVDVLSDDEVDAMIPGVLARVTTALKSDDPRVKDLTARLRASSMETRRAALQQAMDIAYDASDQLHVRIRGFRNILMITAALIAVLMSILVVLVALHPKAMPLCFHPTNSAPPATAGAEGGATVETVCPGGDRVNPGSGDVIIVAGLGLLGGALAAAFAIRNIRGTSTPYDVPIALALLKVPSGALTATAGILLLGGGFVPGLSELDSQRQILAYALVFGYAQQLATRLIDNQGQSLLNSIPSKDPEAKQPEPAPVPSAPEPPAPETEPELTEQGAGG